MTARETARMLELMEIADSLTSGEYAELQDLEALATFDGDATSAVPEDAGFVSCEPGDMCRDCPDRAACPEAPTLPIDVLSTAEWEAEFDG